MLESLVGQFLKSGSGADVLGQLKSQGLDEGQAQQAVSATAEGVLQHGGTGGIAGALGGGSGLGAMAAGMLGGQGAQAGIAGLAAPVAQFVAQRTGLSPAVAQTVVSMVLPKILAMMQSGGGVPASGAPAAGGLGGMLGNLIK